MKNIESKFLKRVTLAVLTVIIFGAGVFATTVSAQTVQEFEVQIPFDFIINDQTFEAGTYRIGRLNEANPRILVIKTTDRKSSRTFLTQLRGTGVPIEVSELTFRRFGGTYFLDSIRASGQSYESRIPVGKSDRIRPVEEIIRLAKNSSAP